MFFLSPVANLCWIQTLDLKAHKVIVYLYTDPGIIEFLMHISMFCVIGF